MRNLLLIASLALISQCAFAISCGDTVSGVVTLNADLVCNNINGLNIGADNTTINLNTRSHNNTLVSSKAIKKARVSVRPA